MRWLLFLVLFLMAAFVFAQPIYCDGCSFEGRCVDFHSQTKTSQGTLYCSDDSKLYPVKPDAAPCSANYECQSFFCSGAVCTSGSVEPLVVAMHSPFFFIALALGSLVVLALIFLLVRHSLKPKVAKKSRVSPKQQTAMPSTIKLMPVKKKYSQFEGLEKSLDETTKKIVKK